MTLLAMAIAACGDSGTENQQPTVAVALANSTATITQGQSMTIPVTITRTNFSGNLNLSIEGLPAGVTGSFNPGAVPGNTAASVLTLEASPTAAPVTATINVFASGMGVTTGSTQLTVTINVAGNYTLSAAPTSVTVAQGASNIAIVDLVRAGGFTGAVALSFGSLPAGLSADVTPFSTAGSSTLTLTAAASTAVGTYTVNLIGATPGLPNQTLPITVRVVVQPTTTPLSLDYCANSIPVWFGVKNEGSGWTRITANSNGTFNFPATDRTIVTYVFQSGSQFARINLHTTVADLQPTSGLPCIEESGAKSYTGTFANVAPTQVAIAGISMAGARTTAGGPLTFNIAGIPDGPFDLIAARLNASSVEEAPDRLIIRRALNLPTGSALPPLDFAAAESFAPAVSNITLSGLPVSGTEVNVTLNTANGTSVPLHAVLATNGTMPVYSVPLAQLITGDMHELSIITFAQITLRGLFQYFRAPADQAIAVGPDVPVPTVSTVSTSPFVRVRSQLASQTNYGTAVVFEYSQASRYSAVFASTGYLGGTPTTWDLVEPDMTGAPGYLPSYALASGQTQLIVTAYGATRAALTLGADPTDGEVMRIAARALTFNANTAPGPVAPRAQRVSDRSLVSPRDLMRRGGRF